MEDHPRALGWTPGPEDDRDFLFSTFAPERPTLSGEKGWGWAGMYDLDQLSEGACTSFSIGNSVNCEPRRGDIDSDFCFDAYHATTERDEFPGDWNTGQEGTSLRSAMQEWRRRRKISSFAFSYSVEEVVNWVLTRGPVCIGVHWYEGMHDPMEENDWYLEPTGEVLGGHAICVPRVHWGMGDDNFVVLLNSWGRANWGKNGRAKLSEESFRALLEDDPMGTAIAAIE